MQQIKVSFAFDCIFCRQRNKKHSFDYCKYQQYKRKHRKSVITANTLYLLLILLHFFSAKRKSVSSISIKTKFSHFFTFQNFIKYLSTNDNFILSFAISYYHLQYKLYTILLINSSIIAIKYIFLDNLTKSLYCDNILVKQFVTILLEQLTKRGLLNQN